MYGHHGLKHSALCVAVATGERVRLKLILVIETHGRERSVSMKMDQWPIPKFSENSGGGTQTDLCHLSGPINVVSCSATFVCM